MAEDTCNTVMPGNRKAEPQGGNQVPLGSSRPHVGGQVPWGSAKQCLMPAAPGPTGVRSHASQHRDSSQPLPQAAFGGPKASSLPVLCVQTAHRERGQRDHWEVVLLHQPAVMEQTLPGGHGMSFRSPELCEAGGAACKELFSGSKGPGQLLHMR